MQQILSSFGVAAAVIISVMGAAVTYAVPTPSAAALETSASVQTTMASGQGLSDAICVVKVSSGIGPCPGFEQGPVSPPTVPSPGAFPSAATTGVPAGTALLSSSGLTVTTAGSVISGLRITGNVTIKAPNVTIQNSVIIGRVENLSSNLVLRRVEIQGPGTAGAYDSAVGWASYTCDGCNVWGWGKAFYMEDNVTITNSWVHDLSVSGDPAQGGSHNEAIFTQGGANFVITGNRLDAGTAPNFSASIALYGQQKAVSNALVQGNLMNGGGFCLYAGYDAGVAPINTRIIGNTFGNSAYGRCGKFGEATAYTPGNGNQWSGNVGASGNTVSAPGSL